MNKLYIKILVLILGIIFLAGCAYYNTFYNAQQYFKKARKQIENNKSQSQQGGISTEARQNLNQAITKSKKVLFKYPDSRWADNAQYLLAIANYYKGNYRSAKEEFEKFLFDYPESDLRIKGNIWYGKTLWNLGQKDAALQQWETTADKIKTDEVLGELYFLMGESFREKQQLDSAVIYYKKVSDLKKSERRADALFNLVDITIDKNQNAQAEKYLDELADMVLMPKEEDRMQVLQIEVYRKQGQYAKAREIINKKLNSENFKEIWGALELQLALIIKEEGDLDRAVSRLENVTENYKNTGESAHAYYLLGEIFAFQKKDYEKAINYYSKVGKEDNQSQFKSDAQDKKNILTEFQKKNNELATTDELIMKIENRAPESDSLVSDSAMTDSLSREELKKQAEKDQEVSAQNVDTLQTYEKYYRLQYEIAEIYYFDLNMKDTAKTIFRKVANSYKYNPYISKAIYALYYINQEEGNPGRAEYYKQRLEKEYPESPYLAYINQGKVPVPEKEKKAKNLYQKAEEYIEETPDTSIKIFKDLIQKYPATDYSEKGALGIAWLYQNKLYSADSALKWYKYYQEKYPEGEEIKFVNASIKEINDVIKAMQPDTSSGDSIQTADSLASDVEQDSVTAEPDSLIPREPSVVKDTSGVKREKPIIKREEPIPREEKKRPPVDPELKKNLPDTTKQ